jgi:hypothetical protein
MGLGQERQPTQATGLNHREIQPVREMFNDLLAFLLHQQPEPEIMQLCHGLVATAATLAAAD